MESYGTEKFSTKNSVTHLYNRFYIIGISHKKNNVKIRRECLVKINYEYYRHARDAYINL